LGFLHRPCPALETDLLAARQTQRPGRRVPGDGRAPMTLKSAAAFLKHTAGIDAQQCPCCSAGRLRVVQTLAGPRQLPTASSTVLPQGRARHDRPCAHWRQCLRGALWRARCWCGRSGGQEQCGPCESLRSRALRSENCQPARLPVPAQLWLAKGAGTSP
jgi:hypothetical protein